MPTIHSAVRIRDEAKLEVGKTAQDWGYAASTNFTGDKVILESSYNPEFKFPVEHLVLVRDMLSRMIRALDTVDTGLSAMVNEGLVTRPERK